MLWIKRRKGYFILSSKIWSMKYAEIVQGLVTFVALSKVIKGDAQFFELNFLLGLQ